MLNSIKGYGFTTLLIAMAIIISPAKAEPVPKNATKNYYGAGWRCNKGFKQEGAQCIAIKIPENGKLSFLGNDWECNRGFAKSGTQCVTVIIPNNGKLNYFGNDWDCQKGFYKAGNACLAVIIPVNGKLNFFGNGWDCQEGFKKVNEQCIQMTTAEVQQQRIRMQQIREEIQKRKLAGVSGDHCETEYKTNAQVCVSVDNAEIDCRKSYAGEHYRDCDVSLNYTVKTDYAGGATLDSDIDCQVEIEYLDRNSYSKGYDSSSQSDSQSLYAHDSNSETIQFNFSFSSYKEVYRVKILSSSCEVESVDMY